MTRRGHGEGSVYRHNDKLWAAAITLPNGRRQVFYAHSRHEAAEKLNTALHSRHEGVPIPSGRETVAHFLDEWLEMAKPQVRERTWVRYEQLVRVHLQPTLGKKALKALQPRDLQSLYSKLLGTNLSPTTVHHVHMVIHRALGQALRLEMVSRNVADLVDAPRMAHHDMATLNDIQVRQLLTITSEDRLAALWLLAVTTGMRQGELLALRWGDLDLDRRALQVTGTLQRSRSSGGMVREAPKTARSQRRIMLGDLAVAALQQRRTEQVSERLLAGPKWQDPDLVFTTESGGPLDPSELLRHFRRLLTQADLPRIRFHDLRHTAATLMLSRGVHPKVAADMLGHSTVAITLDLYSHSTEPMHRSAADILDEIARGG